MRFSMRLIVAGLVLLCMGVAWLGAQQPHDGGDILRGLLEFRESEPAVGLPDGVHVTNGLARIGLFAKRLQKA